MPTGDENKMSDRVTRLETLVETAAFQYKDVIRRLDALIGHLQDAAMANAEIMHLKGGQEAQWKKIDATKTELKTSIKEAHARINTHMASCPGPTHAVELASEAKKEIIGIRLRLDAINKVAEDANNLPGRMALVVISVIGLLLSNITGGVILWLVIKP